MIRYAGRAAADDEQRDVFEGPALERGIETQLAGQESATLQIFAPQDKRPLDPMQHAVELTITVNPVLDITTTSLADGDRNLSYDAMLVATGASGAAYSWTLVSGELPRGLTLGSGRMWEPGERVERKPETQT